MVANFTFHYESYQQNADHASSILNVMGSVGWCLMYATITAELWFGSKEFANMANNMMEVEREMKKFGIGVHWAFKVGNPTFSFLLWAL